MLEGIARKPRWLTVRGLSRQAFVFAIIFAVVFGVIALLEHKFATWQIVEGESGDLQSTLDDVEDNLFQAGRWRLNWYRQWDNGNEPSSYLILTGSGQLVDLTGDASSLLRTTMPVDKYIQRGPTLVKTDLGEDWLLENRRLNGGNVIAGIDGGELTSLKDPRALLETEIKKYSGKVENAGSIDTTIIRNFVTGSLVVDDSGKVLNTQGGLPLKLTLALPEAILDGKMHTVLVGDQVYAVASRRISTDSPAAVMVAFDLYSTDAIDESLRFNLLLASAAWLLAFSGYGTVAIVNKLKKNASGGLLEISTRQLIAQGENAPVEFKSTLRKNLETNLNDKKISFSVLKTIAAFINTNGGTLLIGVSDSGTVIGLDADGFANNDKMQLHLTELISDRIGNAHMLQVKMRFETLNEGEILRVDCTPGREPAYVKTENNSSFFVRTGPRTKELPLNEVHSYIRSHFER